MKSKLFIFMAALMSAFVLGSCMDENESYEYPTYERVVTVGAEAKKLYSDNGEILKPVNSITGLDKVERAIVAFNLISPELDGAKLEAGKTYDVELDANYCYSIPTSKIIDLDNNAVAADSLINTQQPLSGVNNVTIKNGYLTANLTFVARQYIPYYVNMAFDSEKDVNLETNSITFTLYYDTEGSLPGNVQVSYPFSFRLPSDLYFKFSEASTINVDVQYMAGMGGEMNGVSCTMKPDDFYLSSY